MKVTINILEEGTEIKNKYIILSFIAVYTQCDLQILKKI